MLRNKGIEQVCSISKLFFIRDSEVFKMFKKIEDLICSSNLADEDLKSIAFLCETIVQERAYNAMHEQEEDARRFFYTGE